MSETNDDLNWAIIWKCFSDLVYCTFTSILYGFVLYLFRYLQRHQAYMQRMQKDSGCKLFRYLLKWLSIVNSNENKGIKRSFSTYFSIFRSIGIGDNFCFDRSSPDIGFHNSTMNFFPFFSNGFFTHCVLVCHHFVQLQFNFFAYFPTFFQIFF